MITQTHPRLAQLSAPPRFVIDLLSGFVLVFVLRYIFTRYSRWRLVRRHNAQRSSPPPVLHLANVPGPKPPSWLWGSEWEMYNSKPGEKYFDWYRRFGRIFKFKGVLGSSFLALADPRAISHVLDRHHCYEFPKPDGERQFFLTLLGKGLIWAEGDAHIRQRRILGPAFSAAALKAITPIFFDSANKASRAWSASIDAVLSGSVVVDIQKWVNHISLDSMGLAGFSFDFQTLDPSKPQHPLARTLEGFTNSGGHHSFSAFLVHACMWAFPAIFRIPSDRQRALSRSRQMLGQITDQVWAERKRAGQDGQDTGKSILELLLQADQQEGNGLDKEEIAAEMTTLLFGGYETTANTITWTLHELALHPEIQQALRAEVSASSSDPTYEELQNGFPLLNAIINETLRVHPSFMQIHREASQDCLIPLTPLPSSSPPGAVTPEPQSHLLVPKGTILVLPINVMQSAADVWGPDAHIWNPYRWLEMVTKEAREKRTDWRRELLIFSAGARGCIGRTFALLEIKAVLATLIRQFVFSPVEGNEVEPLLSFVVRPKVKGESKSTLPLRISKVVY